MRHELRGVVASAGFVSGHRVVVGHWASTPIGPMDDVLWCDPDGRRTLFTAEAGVARFVAGVYEFDRAVVGPLSVVGNGWAIRVELPDRVAELSGGPGWAIPVRRPAWFTRLVEGPVARLALGVRTYGTSPTGVREWYRADVVRPVQCAYATLDGESLGRLALRWEPVRFGFSEPPPRPSLVEVRPLLEDPSGRLDEVVAEVAAARAAVPTGAPAG